MKAQREKDKSSSSSPLTKKQSQQAPTPQQPQQKSTRANTSASDKSPAANRKGVPDSAAPSTAVAPPKTPAAAPAAAAPGAPSPATSSKSSTPAKKRYALLIDADNANPNYIEDVINFVNLRGETFIRRAYGDWTSHWLTPWKKVLQTTAIQPMQQFANTIGKNSTDAAMIIDAMDLLHLQKDLDGMCIVSSDSDFTRLVQRIRQDGLEALGFGEEKKTGVAFIKGCNEFYYVEHIQGEDLSDYPLPSFL